MTEWGVTPEYINNRWTEELLTLMFIKRTARIKRAAKEPVAETSLPPLKTTPPVQYSQFVTQAEQKAFTALDIQPEVVRYASPTR